MFTREVSSKPGGGSNAIVMPKYDGPDGLFHAGNGDGVAHRFYLFCLSNNHIVQL